MTGFVHGLNSRDYPRREKAWVQQRTIPDSGSKLETVLNGLGVWTFAQIAGWTEQEIAWVEDYLSFKGRIGRDDWIAQAAKLSAKKKR